MIIFRKIESDASLIQSGDLGFLQSVRSKSLNIEDLFKKHVLRRNSKPYTYNLSHTERNYD